MENSVSPAKASFSASKTYGRFDHPGGQPADLHAVSFFYRDIHQRNARGLVRRCDHAAAMALFQCRDAVGVIGMVMRHQNVGEFPAGALQCVLDCAGFRCIDRCRRAARRIVQQNSIIVLQANE
jgi:hypothetical protein